MKLPSRNYIFLWLSTSAILVLCVWNGVFHVWQDKLTDLLFIRKATPENIVLVTIDEKSFQTIGQWPWPRATFGKLIDKLQTASVIGIDVNFKEPSRLGIEDDAVLARALDTSRPPVVLTAELQNDGTLIPLAPALQNRARIGFANLILASDGVARVTQFKKGSVSSFATVLAQAHAAQVAGSQTLNIPLQPVRIDYIGPNGSIPSVSVKDVLGGAVSATFFAHKIVLVGATVIDLQDFHETPVGLTSGVEIQANIIETLLGQSFYGSNMTITLISLILLSGIIVAMTAWTERFSVLLGAIVGIFTVYNLLAFISFDHYFILDTLYPNIALFLSAGLGTSLQYFTSAKEKRFIQESFSRYLAPQVIQELIQNPSQLKLGGKREQLTILFSDIRGFTSLSENMSPEQLTHFLNDYLTRMTEIVLGQHGVIDKYIGDAIMAFWGAPLKNSQHALDGVLSAMHMIDALKAFNDHQVGQGNPAINIGIGLNSGEVTVGNMGSERRFDYTVMGDHVNLASRLENLTKTYGVHILVSEATAMLLTLEQRKEHTIMLRELDRVQVKGKKNAVTILEVVPRMNQKKIAEIQALFDQARNHYYQGKWQEAIDTFAHILIKVPDDGPSIALKDRCSGFLHRPAENWQGIFEMTSK